MAASNQAHNFLPWFTGRGKAHYQRGHSAQYSGFHLDTSTFLLSILVFIFIATSHKHCTFTITYFRFENLSLFASYAMLMRPRNLKQLLIRSSEGS